MSEQELDLFEIAAGFAAELGARPSKVMGAEVLDADLTGGQLDDILDRPVAQALADLADLADLPQQRPILDPGYRLPGVDGVLYPERDGDGADAAALPAKVDDDPAVLAHLDLGVVERGQFAPLEVSLF